MEKLRKSLVNEQMNEWVNKCCSLGYLNQFYVYSSLKVQASRIPARLQSTGSHFLPHARAGTKAKTLVPALAWSLQCKCLATGPISLPIHPPQSSCYISSLTTLLFCSLLMSKTDTFYFLHIQSKKGPSIPLPNEHLKHMQATIVSIVKSLFQGWVVVVYCY